MLAPAPVYLFDPKQKPDLPVTAVPLVIATDESVKDYGCLVDEPAQFDIEIVTWPASGWRQVDAGTGNEAGFVEGIFSGEWRGHTLYGSNEAVGGHYVLGWSDKLHHAAGDAELRESVLLWHMNYHPDGGQLFYPLDKLPFVVPVALPGDDLTPDKVIAFWCDGTRGLYIHPNIWHEGIFPIHDRQRFLDRQGRVHARVSCDMAQEFGVYLSVPLRMP
jgi:ureidoglycolate lyase/seryl-tRNA synthetase